MAITYTDKVQVTPNPLPDVNQWKADDANEVKNVVNAHITSTQTALDLKENLYTDFDRKTDTDYTLALTDKDTKGIEMDSTSAHILTVPLNSVIPFPIGTKIPIYKINTGTVTIAATGGVTINSSSGSLVIENRYSGALLEKIDTNEWRLLNGSPSLTWTTLAATITGYQSGLTQDITYIIEGKRCTIRGNFSGLGNTSAVSITNLPAAARMSTFTPILVTNNATNQLGMTFIVASATTMTFYATAALGAFTSNVNRSCFFTVVYEIL